MPALDEASLRALKERRPEALERLVREHSAALYAGALGLGFVPNDAEELVQDTLASFLDAVDRFEGRSQLKTYLFGILYHKASELRRRRGREEPSDEIELEFERRFDARGMWIRPPQGPEAAAVSKELLDWIERCAEGLPAAQRAAFYLKEVEGETGEAACNALGVSPTNLRVLLFRARARLRDCLERNGVR